MNIVAIVQARMGSSRLPGKVLKKLNGTPLIGVLLTRLLNAKTISKIVIATSTSDINDPLVEYVNSLGIECYRGSEDDVLNRYCLAAEVFNADVIVRITGDCPFIDPGVIDQAVNAFFDGGYDYLTNGAPPTFPDGLDVEVFSRATLIRAEAEAKTQFDREHVTPSMKNNGSFKKGVYTNSIDYSSCRWTVDELCDFEVAKNIVEYFAPRLDFSWLEIIQLQSLNNHLFESNRGIKSNEGAYMGAGQKLWKHAKEVIPGGNMLLSKRAEMFLPDLWPAYFSKAKGCVVWDLDGNKYVDMSIMGIGTNILGYGDPDVDQEVRRVVADGNMSTFNCPEEVYLLDKLIEMHPWAEMGRLARTGGEANAIAIRIARAASAKDNVAVCGYHGWHDWYLAANLAGNENLSGHLLPGLNPNGVPSHLIGSIYPFEYNDFEGLRRIVQEHNIGVIKMEVIRNKGPLNDFLKKVRQLATENGIVLIFDECTSGFRQCFGGIHKEYGVDPDIAVFGKALGNGYAINAVLGKREIMQSAQSTFISSTFWTERIGPSAALKTLEVMNQKKSWEQITAIGKVISDRWIKLANKYELNIEVNGIPAISSFNFKNDQPLQFKTYLTQEMLAKGYLASNLIFVSTAHTPEIVDEYFDALAPIFQTLKECENGRDISKLLLGPVCHGGFKRLN